MIRLSLPKSVFSFFIIVLCGVITVGIITLKYERILEEKNVIVRHSKETIIYSSSLLSLCNNIQIHCNQYIATGDSSYLKLYHVSCIEALNRIDTLKSYLLNDLPERTRHLDLVAAKINELILLSDKSIGLKKNSLFNQAEFFDNIIRGNNYLSVINDWVNIINNEEANILRMREGENSIAKSAYGNSLFVLLIFILLLVIFLFILIYYNFNKRIITEEKLRKSESRFFTIANSSPLAIAILDSGTLSFTFVNIAFEELVLLNRNDIIGKSAIELSLINTEKYKQFGREFIIKGNKLKNIEYRIKIKEGIFRDLLFSTDVININEKKFVILTMADISERKKNEELIKKNNELFSKLFHESPAGSIISRIGNETIIDCNQSYAELVGFKRDELIGKSTSELKILTNEQLQFKQKIINEQGSIHNHEMKIRTRDGSFKWVSLSMQTVTINNEVSIISILIDITSHKIAEYKIKSALVREKELNDMKSNFVSMASHEFRTPLATILSSAQLIEKYSTTEMQDKRDKHIRRIESSVKNMISILDEFLSLGKIEEGQLAPNYQKFDLNALTEKICSEMRLMLK